MITLKEYQTRVLDSLRDFFRQCARDRRPEAAFQAVQLASGRAPDPYLPVRVAGLDPAMPYICLRVPTGGGKTLLACYAAGSALRDFMRVDRGIVLWLVPSNTILEQTADALRDPRHSYRRALDLACGQVEVVTIEEALDLSRATVDGQTVVIVATIQAFRAEDTTGRRVYAQNGAFSEHLQNIPADRLAELRQGPDGKPVPSLVNMLRLRRPIIIVDEAHNARTDLSFSMLGEVLPSCIVEFTATPARSGTPSNVLHHVSAAELKAAEMIKLPLRVIIRHPSQRDQLLAEAVHLRGDLEKMALQEAQASGEYLRPILLLQAERVDACEALRDRLVADFAMPKDQVKISVGTRDELRDIADILSPKCPVRIIVTVQKLREGWDCPFAYVLCSLRETRSAVAIEQIVGRILRLPGASLKRHPDLNCAYALSVSGSLPEVLSELRDALVGNGFTTLEAQRIILPVSQGSLPLGAQARTVVLAAGELDASAVSGIAQDLAGKVRIDTGKGEVSVLAPLSPTETAKLEACTKTAEAKNKVRELAKTVFEAERAFGGSGEPRSPSFQELQLDFLVPLLCVSESGELFEFEETHLLEHTWKLGEKDAALPDSYNPLERPGIKAGVVDVGARGEVVTGISEEGDEYFVSKVHQQSLDLSGGGGWTLESLIAWLDRKIDHRDIPAGESAEFLHKVLRGLMAKYAISDLDALALDRFRLRDEIETRIQQHRNAERSAAFKQFLLPDSPLAVDVVQAINFKSMSYEPGWLYDGAFRFQKHYFGPRPGELADRTSSGAETEEFRCAQYLDGMPEVKFWVRNLVRKASSFRLQTSTDWFYPDFVCQLQNGRVLVVEYKGKDRYSAQDAQEKRAIGAVWASRSNGRCLFVMPTEADFSPIVAAARS